MPNLLQGSEYFKRQQEAGTCLQNEDGFNRLCDTSINAYEGFLIKPSDLYVQNGPIVDAKGGVTFEECKAFCESNTECAAFYTELYKLPDRKPYSYCEFYTYPKIGTEYRFDDAMFQKRAKVISRMVDITLADVHRQADINLYIKKGASVEQGIRHAQQQLESVVHPSLKCKRPLHMMRIDNNEADGKLSVPGLNFTLDNDSVGQRDYPMMIHWKDTTTGKEVDPTTVCSTTS